MLRASAPPLSERLPARCPRSPVLHRYPAAMSLVAVAQTEGFLWTASRVLPTALHVFRRMHGINDFHDNNINPFPTAPANPPIITVDPPYSYLTPQYPMNGLYPTIDTDLPILSQVASVQSTEKIGPLVDILVQRNPNEIETLKHHFRTRNAGASIAMAFERVLNLSNEQRSAKYAIMGLVLGPVLFDLYLIENLDRENQELLIDLFIARSVDDIRTLLTNYNVQQLVARSGKNLTSLAASISDEALRSAFVIVTECTRPDASEPVDQGLVNGDIRELIRIGSSSFPNHMALFNILLRRNNQHLRQVNAFYRIHRDRPLDEDIRRNIPMPKIMKQVALRALRSAADLTYRDVMAIRDTMCSDSLIGKVSTEKLAIRICRMHWDKHWRQVKAAYMGIHGKRLVDSLNQQRSLLRTCWWPCV